MPEDPMRMLQRMRDEKEKESQWIKERIPLFLEAGFIAIEACLLAGAAGNVTCYEASKKIIRILKPNEATKAIAAQGTFETRIQ